MKKGFTLIELLAVIVILAIIALIATPIVLSIINDSKTSGVLRSAEMYLNAIEYTVANASLDNTPVRNGIFPITSDGNMCLSELENGVCPEGQLARVEVDGEKPTGGYVEVVRGKIIDMFVKLNNSYIIIGAGGIFQYKEPMCTLNDKDNNGLINTNDEVTCEGENFYVITANSGYVTLLSMYNLDLINNIQSTNSGIIAFSTTNYWWDSANNKFITDSNYSEEGRTFPYVYKSNIVSKFEQNSIYTHVEAYENYLKRNKVDSASAKLIDFEELKMLGCVELDCTNAKNSYPWFYSTTYWTGNATLDNKDNLYTILSGTGISSHKYEFDDPSNLLDSDKLGVRPVVVISTSEIK